MLKVRQKLFITNYFSSKNIIKQSIENDQHSNFS